MRSTNHPALRAMLCALWLMAGAAAQAQGTTVAIGGALQDSNAAVWQRLVQLVQREGRDDPAACYHVITLASGEPAAAAARVQANLARHGGRAVHLQLQEQTPETLSRCRGVYMTGGAQARLLDALQGGPWLAAMHRLHRAGGVVAGSSAGAAVMSEVVFRDAPDVLAVMKGRLREGQEWGRGFGFTPPGLIVDQHAVRRGRMGRLLPLMLATGSAVGVAVEENTAALFSGSQIEVLGARGVLIADLSDARRRAGPAFGLSGGTLHWLESGDRFELARRTVEPAARKHAGTLLEPLSPHHRGYHRGRWVYADILAEGMLVAALQRMVDGDQPELFGLALAARPADDDPDPTLAFEWRLWPDAHTRAWLLTDPDAYTISGVRFDIVPVAVTQPLTRPLPP